MKRKTGNIPETTLALTLEEKVGQMLMFAFHGTSFNSQLQTMIEDLRIGGIIHFTRNIVSPAQILRLNRDIEEHASLPLLIGIDQEGGSVQRIVLGVTPFPGAMALAAGGGNIRKICRFAGSDLRRLHFNTVFAPVADVNDNPENPVINSRSYGDDPKKAADCVIDAFRGFRDAGMLSVIKHFPGHGDTVTDSHFGLPKVSKTSEEAEKTELVPFRSAIKAGVEGIMTGHLLYPAYDEKYPASLSKKIIGDLLRKKLGFTGLIITDSLTMGALWGRFDIREIIIRSVRAGCDILLFCGEATLSLQREIFRIFLDAARSGEIPLSLIDAAVTRILDRKRRFSPPYNTSYHLPGAMRIAFGKKLSLNSVTEVKNNGLLPLGNVKTLVIFPKIKVISPVDAGTESLKASRLTLGNSLKETGCKVDEIILDEETDIWEIKKAAGNHHKIILAVYNVKPGDYQCRVFASLPAEKTIVVAMRSPYDLRMMPNAGAYICIYEASSLALQSLALCLSGKAAFRGKLPVKEETLKTNGIQGEKI